MNPDPSGEASPSTNVSGTNIVIGANSRQTNHFWRDKKVRLLVVAGIVVTVLTGATVIFALLPEPPRPALEVAAVEASAPGDIDADAYDSADPTRPHKKSSLGVTTADITLKNNGNAPALLTAGKVELLHAVQLDDCTMAGGGPARVSADYIAKIPVPIPALPYDVTSKIRFEVKGGAVDRFTYSFGPTEQTTSFSKPFVLVGHLTLEHDNAEDLLDLGNITVITNTRAFERQMKDPRDLECIKKNSRTLADIYQIQAKRPALLDKLRDRYAEITSTEPAVAREYCQSWNDSSLIPRMCATYRQTQLTVSLQLTSPPLVDRSKFIIRLNTGDPAQHYRIIAAWETSNASSSPGPRWRCSEIYDDADYEGTSGSCRDGDTGEELSGDLVLTIKSRVPLYFSYHQITLTAEARTPTGRTSTLLGETPKDKGLIVERGR